MMRRGVFEGRTIIEIGNLMHLKEGLVWSDAKPSAFLIARHDSAEHTMGTRYLESQIFL